MKELSKGFSIKFFERQENASFLFLARIVGEEPR
jgi:hypothetical protein